MLVNNGFFSAFPISHFLRQKLSEMYSFFVGSSHRLL